MYKTENDKQRDVLIGEAIFALLDEKSLITYDLLLKKLHFLLSTDVGRLREDVIHRAIAEVTASGFLYSHPFNPTYDELTGIIGNKKGHLH